MRKVWEAKAGIQTDRQSDSDSETGKCWSHGPRSHMFLMERCDAGVVNMLGLMGRLFEIEYVYSTEFTMCSPEDMCQLYGSRARRRHLSTSVAVETHGSTSQSGMGEWECNIWRGLK